MRLLLDTHVVLWALSEPETLAADARAEVVAPENQVFVSAASAWEIAIKAARGKLQAPPALATAIIDAGFEELPITLEHAVVAGALPRHHGDPFDRMLIAQATLESLTIVTRDDVLDGYGVPLLPA